MRHHVLCPACDGGTRFVVVRGEVQASCRRCEVRARVDDGQYLASGRFPRVIVPSKPGTLDLPPIQLVTFSPTKGEFVTHTLPIGRIDVVAAQRESLEVRAVPLDHPRQDARDVTRHAPVPQQHADAGLAALDGLLRRRAFVIGPDAHDAVIPTVRRISHDVRAAHPGRVTVDDLSEVVRDVDNQMV